MGGKFKFSAQDSNLEYFFLATSNFLTKSYLVQFSNFGNKISFLHIRLHEHFDPILLFNQFFPLHFFQGLDSHGPLERRIYQKVFHFTILSRKFVLLWAGNLNFLLRIMIWNIFWATSNFLTKSYLAQFSNFWNKNYNFC